MNNKYKPTTTISWKDYINALPIDDIRAWQKQLAYDTGYYPELIEMNSNVEKNLMLCKRKYKVKKIEDLKNVIFGDRIKIVINNDISEGKIIVGNKNFNKHIEATIY